MCVLLPLFAFIVGTRILRAGAHCLLRSALGALLITRYITQCYIYRCTRLVTLLRY